MTAENVSEHPRRRHIFGCWHVLSANFLTCVIELVDYNIGHDNQAIAAKSKITTTVEPKKPSVARAQV